MPDKPRGKQLVIEELAALLDVTPLRIRQLIKLGMPVFIRGEKGKPHIFSSYDAIWWYIEYEQKKARGVAKENPDAPDAKQQINAAKLAMAELELAKRRGTLFDFADYVPYIKDKMVTFRQTLSVVVSNTREKFGAEPAKFVDKELTQAINAYQRGLENIPNEVKE